MLRRGGKPLLYSLINKRFHISPPSKESTEEIPIEMKLVYELPNLEKHQFSKFQEDVLKLNIPVENALRDLDFCFSFSEDDARALIKNTNREKAGTEFFALLSCFYSMGWVWSDPKERKDSGFECLIDLLNRSSNMNMRKYVSFCFERILNEALDLTNGVEWKQTSIQPVIVHFYTNQFLQPTCFALFVDFIQLVSTKEYGNSIRDTQLLLEQIIREDRPLLHVEDLTPIILYLQPFIAMLDQTCIRDLCFLSQKNSTCIITDTFILLASSFAEKISSSKPVCVLENDEGVEFVNSNKIGLFTEIFECDDMSKGFQQPPYESCNTEGLFLSSYLAKEIITFSQGLAKSINLASATGREAYLNALMHHAINNQDPTIVCSIVSSIFITFLKMATPEFLNLSLPTITGTYPMSHKITIFGEKPINPWINLIRNLIIDTICSVDKIQIVDILLNEINHPVFLTELFVRIMSHGDFPLELFTSPEMLPIIINSAIELTTVSFPKKYECRSANFAFIFHLLSDSQIAAQCFSSTSFIPNFLSFAYETDMMQTIQLTIRNCLSLFEREKVDVNIVPMVDYLTTVISQCVSNHDNPRYVELIHLLMKALSSSISEQSWLAAEFQDLLPLFLDFIDVHPDSCILEGSLSLLASISRVVSNFNFDSGLLERLYKGIKAVDKNEPSASTKRMLQSLLSGYSALPLKSNYYIKNPCYIPLIIAAFGQSKNFVNILCAFRSLCNYAAWNCRQLHDGDFDYIMVKYITQNSEEASLFYRNIKITIKMAKKDVIEYVMPLIEIISLSKSSNSITTCLSKFIADEVNEESYYLCNYFSQLLCKCSQTPKPSFALYAGEETQFSIDGFIGKDFNSGFTVTFKLFADVTPLTSSNASLNIFTITDDDGYMLRVFISGNKMYVKYEAEYTRTSVQLVRQIPPKEWIMYTFIFSFGESVRIVAFQNNVSLNDSELCEFEFNPSRIDFDCGGLNCEMNSQDWHNAQLGTFGDFNLYTELLTAKDVFCLNTFPWEFDKKPIFSTSCIKTPGIKSEIILDRDPVEEEGLFGEKIDKLIVTVNDCKRPTMHILDNMIDGGPSNILAGFFKQKCEISEYPSMILGLIKSIFKRSITAQKKFAMVSSILGNLYNNQYFIKADLYFAIYEVFLSITYPALRNEWFNNLVFNACLWIHASFTDFYAILTHWYTVLIPNCKDIICTTSYFSDLLTQFKMIFCFSKEDEDIHSLSDVISELDKTKLPFFNETYTVASIFKCRNLFTKILRRIAFSNFAETDIPTLFSHLSTSSTKCTIIQMLKIVTDISSAILKASNNLQKWISVLHLYVKYNDIDIIDNAIQAIHELSLNSIAVHAQTIAMEIATKELSSQVFDRFIHRTSVYPNLYPMLCIIALSIGNKEIDELSSNLHLVSSAPNRLITPNWFVWPIILAFHSTGDTLERIIFFVTAMLNLSNNRESEITQIIYFAILVQFLTPVTNIRYDKMFLLGLINVITEGDVELLSSMYHCLFTTTFYHLFWNSHTKPLINALKDSPFAPIDYEENSKIIFFDVFNEFTHLEQIAGFNPKIINIGYEMLLDEDANWKDADLAKATFDLKDKYGCKGSNSFVNAMFYAYKRSELSEEQIRQYSNFSFTYNEEQRLVYEEDFVDVISSLLNKLSEGLRTSRKFKEMNLDDLTNNLKQESEMLIHCNYDTALKILQATAPQANTFTPDKTFCYAFCPMKKKRQAAKVKHQPIERDEPIFACKGSLINYKHTVAIDFNVYKDGIILSGHHPQKFIDFSQVTHIFSRQNGKQEHDTMIEFFLADGLSYLIDFGTMDASNVMKLFQKSWFKQIKFIWPLRQKNVFQSLPFTQDWIDGTIPTFEYLMLINTFAGRTFNNPDMFPIFPAIACDMNSANYVCDFTHKTKISQEIVTTAIVGEKNVNSRLFFDPSIPGPLPMWASDYFMYVYKLRKLLESPNATKILPMWIDNNFGVKMDKKLLHKQLFKKKHPIRNVTTNPILRSVTRQLQSESSEISFITSFKLPENKYGLIFVLSNGSISYLETTIGQDICMQFISTSTALPITENTTFSASNKGFVLYTPEENTVFILRKDRAEITIPLFIETNIFSYTKHGFLFCSDQCTVSYINEYDTEQKAKTLCHSLCRITTLKSSSRFKIFAYGSVDGYVTVHNLRNGNLVNTIPVGGEPSHLIITRNWGFIVAATSKKISVLSVNGELVRQEEIEVPIKRMFEFDLNGFDYVAYEGIDHRLVYFEAMSPEIRLVFFESRDPVHVINYDANSESFIIVTSESIKVVPQKIG